jgi:PadR family transcriptional regulator, regulatory protein PadR
MIDSNDFVVNQTLEIRRGNIVLAILALLSTPRYGYGLLQTLERSGVVIDAGTLYPMLRRLEKQGVLDSTWDSEDARPRKYYRLSEDGQVMYGELVQEWVLMTENISKIINEETR